MNLLKKTERKSVKKMRKLKIKIEIPELNLVGEIKPLESYALLRQFEEILTQNKLEYTWSMSSYEDRDDIFNACVCSAPFDKLPQSAQELYSNLFDMADEEGFIYNLLPKLKRIKAKSDDLEILHKRNFINLVEDRIEIVDLLRQEEIFLREVDKNE